jgi:hypothetical protein
MRLVLRVGVTRAAQIRLLEEHIHVTLLCFGQLWIERMRQILREPERELLVVAQSLEVLRLVP